MERPPGLPSLDARTPESRETAKFLTMTVDEHLATQARGFSGFWTPVAESLPLTGKANGYWCSVPVIIATADGRVCGAFFTYEGGDRMDVDDWGNPIEPTKPRPVFRTDEGLPYSDVLFWSKVPNHPTIPSKPKTYA